MEEERERESDATDALSPDFQCRWTNSCMLVFFSFGLVFGGRFLVACKAHLKT